jgi:F-type H+-transporting ATPase subunit gamma
MAGMREIKSRIKSIKETKQITKAMKLISAAKLKKARNQLDRTLPFFKTIENTMADVLIHSGNIEGKFFEERKPHKREHKKAYIILAGDKGLAGGYNTNIFKLAEAHIGADKNSKLYIGGHMGKSYFEKHGFNVFKDFDYPVQNPTVTRAREMSEIVLDHFLKGRTDELYIVFTYMVSSIKLEPRVIKILPLDIDELNIVLGIDPTKPVNIDSNMSYEPSPQAVFDVLVPKYIKGIIYCALVEAFTSEQSARMTAMDNATTNAEEMLGKLKLYYNRARQAAITQEISEIVGGAAVLD